MSLVFQNKLFLLKDRAQMLHIVRDFFHKRNIMEVDCPALCQFPPIDDHIDPMKCSNGRYLHTSPEYGMKRLLIEGIGDIYQLSHVFRGKESGSKHNPEFSLIEWYRLNFKLDEMIEETLSLIELFVPKQNVTSFTYKELFLHYAHIEPYSEKLTIPNAPESCTHDELLHFVLSTIIEPKFPKNTFTIVTDFPPSQAALAQVKDGVAKRFEIYYGSIELANGYLELENEEEHRHRFNKLNKMRKVPLPLDEHFLTALNKKLPSCCGVAVGFDRLMMIKHPNTKISDIIPFSWEIS